MSFNKDTFATVGAQAAPVPTVYSYSSTTDSLATVSATGYFESKSQQLNEDDWIFAVLTDGSHLLRVSSDTSTAISTALINVPLDNYSGGFFDYNDTATATTPIAVTGGAGFVKLTNNEAGPFTNKSYKPIGVTDVWDAVGSEFDWSELSLGDMVDLRLDCSVTTTAPNQVIDIRLFLAVGSGSEYSIPFNVSIPKLAGANNINRFNGIYMGDANTLNFPAEFRIQSDANATVVVNGWYCKIIKQG